MMADRNKKRESCSGCGRTATKHCGFQLRGEKSGKTCGRPLCDKCVTVVETLQGATDYCRAHARYIERQTVDGES
jgi:hypothetical protein